MSLSSQQSSPPSSPPKRPRLSLTIKTPSTTPTLGRSATALKADIDPTSPTAFNTLSNAYAAAIEASSPRTPRPPVPETKAISTGKRTSLRLETKLISGNNGCMLPSQRTQTPGPFAINYPDTPSSAVDMLTPTMTRSEPKPLTLACTFTPPQSAGGVDTSQPRVFTFTANSGAKGSINSPRTPRRRATIGSQFQAAPYTHPRTLHSILRNSPLPPRSAVTPGTPTRMSLRIANRADKKVGYNDPLTQTIITNKYVKSHIDLLSEDSPRSANDQDGDVLDQAMQYTGDETKDGGHTPGPFEEMRRRMADSELETPARRKRKRREKKRKWEWTITNTDGEETQDVEMTDKTPITAIRIEKTPNTAIFMREVSVSTSSETSDGEDRQRCLSVESSTCSERPGSSQSL